MITYCAAQGTLLNALCGPPGEGHGERGNVCIRVADALFCIAETNTTLSVSCTPIKSLIN